jgi:hypothetical protein
MLWLSLGCYKETFIYVVVHDYRRRRERAFVVTFGGHALPRLDAWEHRRDAVCSDQMQGERVAWSQAFLSVDGRCRRFEGCLLGVLGHRPGWVRKQAFPVDEGGGLAWGKPPSHNCPCISPFESGYPLIPFL